VGRLFPFPGREYHPLKAPGLPWRTEKPEEVITTDPLPPQILVLGGKARDEARKYYVDQGSIEVVAHFVSELDADGKQLRVVRFTDYTGEKVRSMFPSAADLRSKWSDSEQRAEIIQALEERGITLEERRRCGQSEIGGKRIANALAHELNRGLCRDRK
jgi:type I restriction enzyme R subunit